MVACIINETAPIVLGDLLISSSEKPLEFFIPSLDEDVLKFLPNISQYHPQSLNQKLYILKYNVCIAFSGKTHPIKKFLEDITIFCRVNDIITAENMKNFLDDYSKDEMWNDFSFVMLIIEKEDDELKVGRVLHGNWVRSNTSLLGEIFASGSGSRDFLQEVHEEMKIKSSFPATNIDYVLQVNTLMICKLLAQERLNLSTIKNFWGAGFEMIYFDSNQFTKLDNITYIINIGKAENGKLENVPVPETILNYRYHADLLIITSIRLYEGNTREIDSFYVFRSTRFNVVQYIVTPIDYKGDEDFKKFEEEVSFSSKINGMGYLIETEPTSYFTPVSFNSGPEIEVEFKYPDYFTMKVLKSLNDTIISESAKGLK